MMVISFPLVTRSVRAGIEQVDQLKAPVLGQYGALDKGIPQADVAAMSSPVPGKEWILPVTANNATKQAAFIADLTSDAAQKLCASYTAKKAFCAVKKPQEIVQPFSTFWR